MLGSKVGRAKPSSRTRFLIKVKQYVTIKKIFSMPKDIYIFVILNLVIYIAITDFCVSTNGGRQPEKVIK